MFEFPCTPPALPKNSDRRMSVNITARPHSVLNRRRAGLGAGGEGKGEGVGWWRRGGRGAGVVGEGRERVSLVNDIFVVYYWSV